MTAIQQVYTARGAGPNKVKVARPNSTMYTGMVGKSSVYAARG